MATTTRSQVLKVGTKIHNLFELIKQEMIGDRMHFSLEFLNQVKEKLSIKKDIQVWNTLQGLDKKGLIIRKRIKGQKGFEVSLPQPETAGVEKETRKRGILVGKGQFQAGSRPAQLMAYLKRVIVESPFLFTSENIQQVMNEVDFPESRWVWSELQRLEERGFIVRKKVKGQNGIYISFPQPETMVDDDPDGSSTRVSSSRSRRRVKRRKQVVVPPDLSLDQLIENLRVENKEMRETLVSREKTYNSLVSARAELKRR